MPIDPFAALNALLRAEAARFSPPSGPAPAARRAAPDEPDAAPSAPSVPDTAAPRETAAASRAAARD
ncbi:hypothetical protein [Streptomyces toxytricini]|uniref:Uncharacterized protein n=1 Tax=Streptomyces toxytricini TaxID=67369 RepID=A0ABW8EI64_STRT5